MTSIDFVATPTDHVFTCAACGFSKALVPRFAALQATLPTQKLPTLVKPETPSQLEERRRWLLELAEWAQDWEDQ